MAVVRGIREKVHLPLYDSIAFEKEKPIDERIRDSGNVIKFFVNIQNKTKLDTNQQESSVLSHYNTYEVRALRVIVEPPQCKGDKATQDDSDFLAKFIYNSVTTFVVGEKIMIQAPTWFFPSGAGPSNLQGLTNGTPTPEATMRLAEPVSISHQQNYRVEIEFPKGVDELGFDKVFGPSRIWTMLDGYIARDVQ